MEDKVKQLGLVGYSLGKDRGQLDRGIEICSKVIKIDPTNSDNYIYLGRLYILADKKELAIKTFKAGLKIRRDNRAIEELKKFGIRRHPPIDSLPRDHKLNIIVGKLLKWGRLR